MKKLLKKVIRKIPCDKASFMNVVPSSGEYDEGRTTGWMFDFLRHGTVKSIGDNSWLGENDLHSFT